MGFPLSSFNERNASEIIAQLKGKRGVGVPAKTPSNAVPLPRAADMALPDSECSSAELIFRGRLRASVEDMAGDPMLTASREYRWHPTRKFRADYAWPAHKLIMEKDGGLFVNGGHSRGKAREYDMEKDAEAMMQGWTVLRVSPRHMKSGQAVAWVKALLANLPVKTFSES